MIYIYPSFSKLQNSMEKYSDRWPHINCDPVIVEIFNTLMCFPNIYGLKYSFDSFASATLASRSKSILKTPESAALIKQLELCRPSEDSMIPWMLRELFDVLGVKPQRFQSTLMLRCFHCSAGIWVEVNLKHKFFLY